LSPGKACSLQAWIYDYGMLDEFAVAAYWAGYYRDCLEACEALLAAGKIPGGSKGARRGKCAGGRARKLAV